VFALSSQKIFTSRPYKSVLISADNNFSPDYEWCRTFLLLRWPCRLVLK